MFGIAYNYIIQWVLDGLRTHRHAKEMVEIMLDELACFGLVQPEVTRFSKYETKTS